MIEEHNSYLSPVVIVDHPCADMDHAFCSQPGTRSNPGVGVARNSDAEPCLHDGLSTSWHHSRLCSCQVKACSTLRTARWERCIRIAAQHLHRWLGLHFF